MIATGYVMWFEQMANMDSGLEEEERHWIDDLQELLLPPAPDDDGMPDFDSAQRAQEIEDMRRMAGMVNEAMGGESR
jgi:hypothetical protein